MEQGTASLEKLRSRLGSISNLPTPPVAFSQTTKIINNPKSSVDKLAEEVIDASCQQLLEDYANSNTFLQMVTVEA